VAAKQRPQEPGTIKRKATDPRNHKTQSNRPVTIHLHLLSWGSIPFMDGSSMSAVWAPLPKKTLNEVCIMLKVTAVSTDRRIVIKIKIKIKML